MTDHVARPAEETYVFAEQVHHEDGLVSDLTLVEVSRTGNALYIDSKYGAPGGDPAIGELLPLMEQASQVPLEAMCVFSHRLRQLAGHPEATSRSADAPASMMRPDPATP